MYIVNGEVIAMSRLLFVGIEKFAKFVYSMSLLKLPETGGDLFVINWCVNMYISQYLENFS